MPPPTRRDLLDPATELTVMSELTRRVWTPGTRWHLGDLTWSRYQHLPPVDWPAAAWYVGDTVAAWARVPEPGHLDLQVDPAHPALAVTVLDWFESLGAAVPSTGESPNAGSLNVTLLDTETHIAAELVRRGYRQTEDGPYFVHLLRDLAALPEPVVPPGYRLRPVAGAADSAKRAAAHAAAFSLPGHPSKVTADSYRNLMSTPFYRPELDWIVEYEDQVVAFCLVWLAESTASACLEPVGCDPAHRRSGLASAAILAGLRAAARQGATRARVCARGDDAYPSARALYRAVGFTVAARNRTWCLSVNRSGEPPPPPGREPR